MRAIRQASVRLDEEMAALELCAGAAVGGDATREDPARDIELEHTRAQIERLKARDPLRLRAQRDGASLRPQRATILPFAAQLRRVPR